MKLLATGGSGFLGGHVLAEAARRGHSCIGLAGVFARARCDALVNLASLGFGHAPAIVGAAASSGIDRAVFVSTTAVTTTVTSRTKPVRLAAEETIRSPG